MTLLSAIGHVQKRSGKHITSAHSKCSLIERARECYAALPKNTMHAENISFHQ